jgi:hypothetical protein
MSHWLHYNLEHPIVLAVGLTMLPMTLINLSAQRKRRQGLPPPYILGWQRVLLVVLMVDLCIVAAISKPG